jgi:hypothetical protein
MRSSGIVIGPFLSLLYPMSEHPQNPDVRTGQSESRLSHAEFAARFRARFADPAFAGKSAAIEELLEVAWDGYRNARKSPLTRKAGAEFADPDYDLSVDWLQARSAIQSAQKRRNAASGPPRILLICGAARNDKSCPGEMSKTFRMVHLAKSIFDQQGAEVDLLDLSAVTS